ncbi:hypothetical protein ACT453_55420, partial [Bacillus sp. D-CC]
HIETPALFKQYYKDNERTAMQFRGDYYITGDKAKKDEDGYFWFEEGRRFNVNCNITNFAYLYRNTFFIYNINVVTWRWFPH